MCKSMMLEYIEVVASSDVPFSSMRSALHACAVMEKSGGIPVEIKLSNNPLIGGRRLRELGAGAGEDV